MHPLSHHPNARRRVAPRTLTPALGAVAACLFLVSCQSNDNVHFDHHTDETRVPEAQRILFESDNRYVAMDLVEARTSGIVDDDAVVAYLMVPWSGRDGFHFGNPGVGVGWSSVAAEFSEMFNPKSEWNDGLKPIDWSADPESSPTTRELAELSIQRSTIWDPSLIQEIDAGRRLQILDYGEVLGGQPKQLEIAGPNPENRATD